MHIYGERNKTFHGIFFFSLFTCTSYTLLCNIQSCKKIIHRNCTFVNIYAPFQHSFRWQIISLNISWQVKFGKKPHVPSTVTTYQHQTTTDIFFIWRYTRYTGSHCGEGKTGQYFVAVSLWTSFRLWYFEVTLLGLFCQYVGAYSMEYTTRLF